MRAGNYFTVTMFHPTVSLTAASGEWVVSEGTTRDREHVFVYSSRLPETGNQTEK
jgi:hypothetical protein